MRETAAFLQNWFSRRSELPEALLSDRRYWTVALQRADFAVMDYVYGAESRGAMVAGVNNWSRSEIEAPTIRILVNNIKSNR